MIGAGNGKDGSGVGGNRAIGWQRRVWEIRNGDSNGMDEMAAWAAAMAWVAWRRGCGEQVDGEGDGEEGGSVGGSSVGAPVTANQWRG